MKGGPIRVVAGDGLSGSKMGPAVTCKWTPGRGVSVRIRWLAVGVILGLCTGVGCGCGSEERIGTSTARYRPPSDHRVVVEAVVEAPFDATWDRLVQRLSESSLHLSTFDAASHFMVVEAAFSSDEPRPSDRPRRYADCGRIEGSYTNGEHTEAFAYDVADASHHVEAQAGGGAQEVRDLVRAIDLAARATVHLRPEGERQTRLTVNARYTLSVETSWTARGTPRDAGRSERHRGSLRPSREEARFTTFTTARLAPTLDDGGGSRRAMGSSGSGPPGAEAPPVCGATGELERELIALAEAGS